MMARFKTAGNSFAGILFAVFFASAASADFNFSGYAKSLDFISRDSAANRYRELSGNRFRLDGEWQDSGQRIDLKAISDHEFLYGSLLGSQRQAVNSTLGKDELLDLNWTLNEKENLIWRHALYRLHAGARYKDFEAVAGRQRIA